MSMTSEVGVIITGNLLLRYESNGSGYSWYVYREADGRRESATTEQIIEAQRVCDDRKGDK